MIMNFDKNIFFVKNKDFHTIQIKVIFPFYEEVEDIAYLRLLSPMVSYMNEKYDTEESFSRNKKKNYILATACSNSTFGTNVFFTYTMIIPDTKSLGCDMLEEQFDFFENFIYHPKVVDGCFDEFQLNREKNDFKMQLANGMKNLNFYQGIKVIEAFDTKGIISRGVYKNPELVDKVTSSSLYDFYKKKIYDNSPLFFVFGDCDEDKITELINKYLVKNKKKISFEKRFNYFLEPRDKVHIVNDKGPFKDSAISLVYKVKDMTEDDFTKLNLISSLLSSLSSRLLQKVLRDEHELIYSSRSSSYVRAGVLEITAFINKKNKDLVIEKIKEVVESLKDSDFIREFLNNIIERRRLNLLRLLDDKYSLLDEQVGKYLGVDLLATELYDLAKKVSAEELSRFVDRLVLDTIYFVEEEDNE